MDTAIDTQGMKEDRAKHKKAQFTPQNHLIHGPGPDGSKRQTAKHRKKRLIKFMTGYSDDQILAQVSRWYAKAGRRYRVSAWSI